MRKKSAIERLRIIVSKHTKLTTPTKRKELDDMFSEIEDDLEAEYKLQELVQELKDIASNYE